jgi:hypothetical protein
MNIIERVKNILTKPKLEWLAIQTESTKSSSLLTSYLLPLAVLTSLATFIGYAFVFRYGDTTIALYIAIIQLVSLVVAVYATVYIADALAPSFGSEKNLDRTAQLVIYASTPVFIGGLLTIIPDLGWLGLLAGAVYSIYLLFLGLPILKKTPEDKVPIYLIVIVLAAGVIYWLVAYIIRRIIWSSVTSSIYR